MRAHRRAHSWLSAASAAPAAAGACVHQTPAAVSSTTTGAASSTMRPPPTAPPEMCSRALTNTAPCWYRAVGITPARAAEPPIAPAGGAPLAAGCGHLHGGGRASAGGTRRGGPLPAPVTVPREPVRVAERHAVRVAPAAQQQQPVRARRRGRVHPAARSSILRAARKAAAPRSHTRGGGRTAARASRRRRRCASTGRACRRCPAPTRRPASACRRCRRAPPGSGWRPARACARTARSGPRPAPSPCARAALGRAAPPGGRACGPGGAGAGGARLCQRGRSKSVKSSTCRSSEASPAGPIPPCAQQGLPHVSACGLRGGRGRAASGARACTTTMLPTAAAACAARGEGGSPWGAMRSHLPLRTSMMCTSLVAPASLMPARAAAAARLGLARWSPARARL